MSSLFVELDGFVYGRAPKPVTCGRGLVIGDGTVVPELNFTLPPMDINEGTWPDVRAHYTEMIGTSLQRAVELGQKGVLIEFETLPPMTVKPEWGLEISRLLAEQLDRFHREHGLKGALRLTPNDTREFERPPLLRRGRYWEAMLRMFDASAANGANLLAIESTGGKEICDEALVQADLRTVVFALGVLGARDMAFLWKHIVESCRRTKIVASGDTACGFANTAMVLAEKKMIPRLFAAVVRVASVPRSLVAYEQGAVGPSKDCAYEGPYMKAMAGVPISMEGRSAACAHFSPVGNISQAVCDCWSNESIHNVQLLSGKAPVVSMEQLIYDCRLLNTAARQPAHALLMRDWLTDSDAALDPQAHVLRPDVVLELSKEMMKETTPYLRTVRGVRAALASLREASEAGTLHMPERELCWFDLLDEQASRLPDREDDLVAEMLASPEMKGRFLPAEYGLA
jgi:methanol---5-hydroxybenzimidazolylcobamide Co-methyltransferase